MTPKLRGSYRFVDADCGTVPVTSDDVQETEETLQRAAAAFAQEGGGFRPRVHHSG